MLSMGSESVDGIPDDIEFCRAVVARVPSLRPVWEKHLDDEFGEVLPYVFLADVARWAELNVVTQRAAVREVLTALNEGLERKHGDVPNLIVAGFVEAVGSGSPLLPLIDGRLRLWVDYEFGLSDSPPTLK